MLKSASSRLSNTDLSAVSDEEVRKAYDGLNRRPRKRYGWRCPWEVYHGETLHLL